MSPLNRRRASIGGAVGLVAAGALAGGILASTIGASAATNSPSSAPTASSSQNGAPDVDSSTPVRGDEKALSSDVTATLRTKALAAVPGGKVVRVESDSGDAKYEVHMKKSDGSRVTVKFDNNLNQTAVEDGMGK